MKEKQTRMMKAQGMLCADAGPGRTIIIPHPTDGGGCVGEAVKAHFEAVKALCRKMEWTGRYIAGGNYNGDWTFVSANTPDKFRV